MPPPRIGFVTCLTWPDISESDRHVQRALEARGIAITGIPWNAPVQRLGGVDLAVFRSSWDYHHAPEAFLAWLGEWEGRGVRFWNPPDLVRWNLTKRYLLDLEQRGVSVVPTVLLEEPAARHLPAVLARHGWDRAVVKPVVGASGHDATLVTRGTALDVAAAIDSGRIRRPAIVQPFLAEIQTRGEWSLVFIEEVLTHAMLKLPTSGDFRVQSSYGGTSRRADPPASVAAAARRAIERVPLQPLYARVDGVETAAGFLVMELEVHEPSLFFGAAPEAATAFAEAIIRRL
jgi:glutathione synthase/RimK-type ligase-like ATP-grasp enzyme